MTESFCCRACGSKNGTVVLDLGNQPLANNLLRPEDLAQSEPRFPLRLFVCPDCWLLQIADLAAKEVRSNGEFTLPGFGKLVKATRKAREGRNPATGAVIQIPAKTTVKFRLGKSMKDAVGK